MSQPLIARSADLRQLAEEGYTVRLVGGLLVIDDVPFVDHQAGVHHDGALVMPLTLAGDQTTAPTDHTAYFVGGVPCDSAGRQLDKIINNTNVVDLGDGLTAACYFSAKPVGTGKYDNYHQKVTVYLGHIAAPAAALDPRATAKRFRPTPAADEATPFKYADTASSRAGIDALNDALKGERIAIVGLGGTGEYIFDFVAKTPVESIQLFDGDDLLTHNAFRGPGAPSLDQLNARPPKVEHFADIYDNLRNGIVRHPYGIDESNVDELRDMTFVFVAIDDAPAKAPIIAALLEFGIPFVDAGMGVELIDGRLIGTVRTTMGTPTKHDHIGVRIPTVETGIENDYRSNIQIAELNALNAAQAVILWKKHRQIYADPDSAHHAMYSIPTNRIVNDECTTTLPEAAERDAA